ncbi:MAG: hypothetical protein AcusKO_07160 [Acuticoccus sp.]
MAFGVSGVEATTLARQVDQRDALSSVILSAAQPLGSDERLGFSPPTAAAIST